MLSQRPVSCCFKKIVIYLHNIPSGQRFSDLAKNTLVVFLP